jgi:DNA replication protein DnaC
MWQLDNRYSFRSLAPSVGDANARAVEFLRACPLTQSAWLTGLSGVGKTHLAKAALNRHAYRGIAVDVVTGPEIRGIGEMWAESREDEYRRLCAPYLLLIDDIDKVVVTTRALEALWMITDLRYRFGKRNIVTSQLEGKALAESWCCMKGVNQTQVSAIMDRLQPCTSFVIQGKTSLRRTHAPLQSVQMIDHRAEELISIEAAGLREAVCSGNLRLLARTGE